MRKLVLAAIVVLVLVANLAVAGTINRSWQISVAADATTAQTATMNYLGQAATIFQMKVVIPDTTNGVTFTVAITDSAGRTIRAYAGLADNTTHILIPVRVVSPGCVLSVLPSGATGNALTVTIEPSFMD